MKKIKEFLEKKQGDTKFKKAGTGHRLADQQEPSRRNQTSQLDQQQFSRRDPGPDRNVAQAALARFETKNKAHTTKPTLNDILKEEKTKITEELKMKDELEKLRLQKEAEKQEANINPYKEFEESQLFTCQSLDLNSPVLFKDIVRQIKSSIYDNFSDDAVLRSAMILFNCNRTIDQNNSKLNTCLDILSKVINNLMTDDPEQLEKFKRIRRSKLEQKVLSLDGALDFLFAIGFTVDSDSEWLVFVDDNNSNDIKSKMAYLKDLLSTPQIIPIELDRQVKYVDSQQNQQLTSFDEADLKLSAADAKKFYSNLERTREIDEMFISRQTKAKLIAGNDRLYDKPSLFTKLRFKLSFDSSEVHTLEAVFYSTEKLSDVKTWFLKQFGEAISSATNTNNSDKDIQFKHGLDLLKNDQLTLNELKLSPASTLLPIVK